MPGPPQVLHIYVSHYESCQLYNEGTEIILQRLRGVKSGSWCDRIVGGWVARGQALRWRLMGRKHIRGYSPDQWVWGWR